MYSDTLSEFVIISNVTPISTQINKYKERCTYVHNFARWYHINVVRNRYLINVIGKCVTSHYCYIGKKYHKHNLASEFRPKFNSTPFLLARSTWKPIFFTFPRRQIYTPPYIAGNGWRWRRLSGGGSGGAGDAAGRAYIIKQPVVGGDPQRNGKCMSSGFTVAENLISTARPPSSPLSAQYFITARAFLLINHSSPPPFNYVPDPANVWLHFHRTSN